MKHDYLDKYSDRDSILHNLDPRTKMLCFFLAVIAVVSEPRGDLTGFPFYYFLSFMLAAVSRIPFVFIAKRCLIASPFIVMAAGILPLSHLISGGAGISQEIMAARSVSILLKAFAAIILLTLLTSTDRFHRLLSGMRKLKFPPVFGILSALMYRYIFILNDEMLRTSRARKSRTSGKIRSNRFLVYGHQAALIFLRGMKRARDVYNAMLSRGFSGEFPEYDEIKFKFRDAMFAGVFLFIFAAVRFGL